jgi:hypothetical protein
MPRLSPGRVAQRVRYPNGTLSDPFIAPMSRGDMERFAKRIFDDQWPEWKGCLDDEGRVDVQKLEAKKAADDFCSGSARLACAHDGRFWRTTEIWSHRCHDWDVQIGSTLLTHREGIILVAGDDPNRRLAMGEMAILFHHNDEFGWQALVGLGIKDPVKALARTVIAWLPQIEEWSEDR